MISQIAAQEKLKTLGAKTFFGAVVMICLCVSAKVFAQNHFFDIVNKKQTAEIYVTDKDFKVVKIAAEALANDVRLIADKRLKINSENSPLSKQAIIIGTLEKNELIEKLIRENKINVAPIRNKRETYLITTVSKPFPNVENALVIVGSDRRGTAFGVFEVSERIGVSPWVWWADSLPAKRERVSLFAKKIVSREPSVKYRGIFLNDEDWGLQPWAAKTFEPETGDIGPKTYAKIFELLLRLKANTCWSAMHEVTKPFNEIAGNAQTADDYAIVMGSSHAEPMLRNNVGEWKDDKAKYNFVANETGVVKYWEERVKTNGRYENVYTLGMRGIHDSPIQGAKTQAERIPILEKLIAAQRNLLARYVDRNVEKVPQIFCPYKEVLADYRAGLKVPDDVTIVFPDDNFGYIRYFPNAEERKRTGGFGVYYHISYLGRPLSYLWLNSTPPALIREEMVKAFDNEMREFWMLNVGDIKPAEIGIEYFMKLAYDQNNWRGDAYKFLAFWANREFGKMHSSEIAALLDQYYRLGFQRKPEHLQFYLPNETPKKSDFTEAEILERLDDYNDLRSRADAVYAKIPPHKKDAFYEMILYPARAAQLANERYFAAELAQIYKQQNRADALRWAQKSVAADREIAAETAYFNDKLQNGKWRGMMSPEMGENQWKSMRAVPPKISLPDFQNTSSPNSAVAAKAGIAELPQIPNFSGGFVEANGVISIEAENFAKNENLNGFAWQVVRGLGKTGDSITVYPQIARTFADDEKRAPIVEYPIYVAGAGDFEIDFLLLPTQPLVAGNGLRLAFAIDGGEPQLVEIDKDTEVSTAKWAQNVLNQTAVGTGKIRLEKGRRTLKIFAVDTGVVLDKIVLRKGALPKSYFAPKETRIR